MAGAKLPCFLPRGSWTQKSGSVPEAVQQHLAGLKPPELDAPDLRVLAVNAPEDLLT